jgi:uncharacterized RmlC-like cupin family protein
MSVPTSQSTPAACSLMRAGEQFTGKQGLQYAVGISAESVGSQAIHMQLLSIPPQGRAKAHKHATHETAIYVMSGEGHVWHGERLEHHSIVKPGDFFYIPADVPHLPYNPSETETVVAVIARTDPNEQESVVLLPELEGIHPV